jgi:hypothetical protein
MSSADTYLVAGSTALLADYDRLLSIVREN